VLSGLFGQIWAKLTAKELAKQKLCICMSNSGQIQPNSSGGQISRFDPVENADDLLNNLNKCRHTGEKIGQFKEAAEQNPAVAFTSFVTILKNQTLLPMRALAIRGFGWIEHKATKADIAACQSEYSQQLLKLLSAEVLGNGKNGGDLLRWAAADAIDGINFDSKYLHHPEYGNLHEPTARLAKEVLERKRREINQVQRLNNRGEKTAEYDRHLEFWIYGPTVELFKENSSTQNYCDVVSDVLLELQELGIILALDIPQSERPNYIAQESALDLTDGLYRRSVEIQQMLYGYLEQFLLDDSRDIHLRVKAAGIVNQTSTWKAIPEQLNLLSNAFFWNVSSDDYRYQSYQTVVCQILEKFQAQGIVRAIDIFNKMIPNEFCQSAAIKLATKIYQESSDNEQILYPSLEKFLLDENRNTDLRINVAHIIKITANWKPIADKLNLLSRMLLWQEKLRNTGVEILRKERQILSKVNIDADNLIEALEYKYFLTQPNTEDLTVAQIDNYLQLAEQKLAEQKRDGFNHLFGNLFATNLIEPLEHKYFLTQPNTEDLTVAQIDNYLQLAEQKRNEVNHKFGAALQSADKLGNQYKISASTVKTFVSGKQNLYLSDINQWVNKLKDKKEKLENEKEKLKNEQAKIKHNQSLLNQVFADSESISKRLIDALMSIPNQGDRKSQNYQTYPDCSALNTSLLNLRKDVLYNVEKEISALTEKAEKAKKSSKASIALCLVSGLMAVWTYYGFQAAGWNYGNNSNPSGAWYAKGFPKSQCGSQSSASCWYPVFIKYSYNNWNNILSNHCQDIGGNDPTATSQLAAETGKIQVASFDNEQDAKGFASYMNSQYGSGWVGQEKCY
jgi:hypothetical protein